MSEHFWAWMGGVFVVLIVIFAVIGLERWTAECKARGGHVVHVYKDSICVSADGRLLEW